MGSGYLSSSLFSLQLTLFSLQLTLSLSALSLSQLSLSYIREGGKAYLGLLLEECERGGLPSTFFLLSVVYTR
jgi:hypothetical protein